MSTAPFTALVPAAGYSSRMGRFKPLLPLGASTVLEQTIGALREAGLADIRVVAGHRLEDLAPVLRRAGVRLIENPDYDQGMFTSIRTGFRDLEPGVTAVVLPADIPLVRPATIRNLIKDWHGQPETTLIPAFDGAPGHPPIITPGLRDRVLGSNGEGGLRAILDAAGPRFLEVPDAGVLFDLDHPEDYRRAQERVAHPGRLTSEECRVLLARVAPATDKILSHGRAVARVALACAERLNESGLHLDLDLLETAALAHDLAKGRPDHAAVGARILTDWGFTETAAVVAAHTDLDITDDEELDERHILYLADKMTKGDRVIGLDARFREAMERHGQNPEAREAVARRSAGAGRICRRVESAAGSTLARLLESCGV